MLPLKHMLSKRKKKGADLDPLTGRPDPLPILTSRLTGRPDPLPILTSRTSRTANIDEMLGWGWFNRSEE